ncbi:hypothetical protein TNCV_2553621 [Trichonephila clavipes]|nr:hypothetical protein TNCV_2553621 [Trichonephila clavipes]
MDHYGGLEIIVWTGTTLNGWNKLHVSDRDSETGGPHMSIFVKRGPHMSLFQDAIGLDIVFMHENAKPDRTADVQQQLKNGYHSNGGLASALPCYTLMDKKISALRNNCGIVMQLGKKVKLGEICKRIETQRDCALRIDGRGRLTSFSVEYRTGN